MNLPSIFCYFLLLGVTYENLSAQPTIHYNLSELLNREKMLSTPTSQTTPLENDRPGAISTVNTVWFKDIQFDEGTIDIDLRGKDAFLKSFLGIVFHGVDSVNFDVLYFRPFNFKHADTARRRWSVQYMSLPDKGWPILRKGTPLVYENAADPVPDPDDWFHARIVVKDHDLQVYVNHATKPSLQVHLLNDRRSGRFGLFSDGLKSDFANLSIKSFAKHPKTVHYYNLQKVLTKNDFQYVGKDRPHTVSASVIESQGIIFLKKVKFREGTIELDLRGNNDFQNSFLGIAFHTQDTSRYEVVYFRPFNFNSTDSIRKAHAIQYMNLPDFRWDKLRASHPGNYESAANPAPEANDWFHVKIVVADDWITVYLNHAATPSLTIKSLNPVRSGGIALWSDPEALKGQFADLYIKPVD
jgi:hypothetical protein